MPLGVKRHRARTLDFNHYIDRVNFQVSAGYLEAYDQGKWIKPPIGDNRKLVSPNQYFSVREWTDDETHLGPPYYQGGPFTKLKVVNTDFKQEVDGLFQGQGTYESTTPIFFTGLGDRPWRYVGGFCNPVYPFPYNQSTNEYVDWNKHLGNQSLSLIPSTSGWGPKAWAATAPRIEMASGLVFLSESRDIPRMLKQSSQDFHRIWKVMGGSGTSWKQAPKKVSDSFLNQQFGWNPFLSDLSKFYNAYKNTASYMGRMAHGNDQWKVYRRTLLDDLSETKITSGTGRVFEPVLFYDHLLRPGTSIQWELREQIMTHVTSVGRFKWHNSLFDKNPGWEDGPLFANNSAWDNVQRQMTMYGLRVSPSNIWRATPWTWLVDWGLGIGRNIDRLQEQLIDGVVSQYLYLMHHKTKRLELRVLLPLKSGDVNLTWYRTIDTKQRKEAGSPYGFDSPWESLSPMRLAILAALGISRKVPTKGF